MKRLVWLVLLLIFAAYCYIVWGWLQEGTENFERQRRETCAEHRRDGTPLDKQPQGCRDLVQ